MESHCKRRLRMRPPPPTAATMRARRMMDAMTCTELPATAMGPPHELRRRCLWQIRQEPFCLAIAVEDDQTEYIFECRANIVANGPHKRADQSQTKQTEGRQKFSSRQSSLVFSCSVYGQQWVLASWLAALPACWLASRQGRADREGRPDREVQKGTQLKCRVATANSVLE